VAVGAADDAFDEVFAALGGSFGRVGREGGSGAGGEGERAEEGVEFLVHDRGTRGIAGAPPFANDVPSGAACGNPTRRSDFHKTRPAGERWSGRKSETAPSRKWGGSPPGPGMDREFPWTGWRASVWLCRMGFFDRFTAKKPTAQPAAPTPAAAPVPAPEPVVEKPAAAGGVMPRLAAARAKLAARDLAGAMAIYEEVLAAAGDRADVLLTTSADLGVHGHVRELVQLIAPRYAADRHGPGPGINLLQAYLAVRDPESAQHLLDLLFSLNKPDLEERLIGFSRVIAELSVSDNAPAEMSPRGERASISLVSISKPIWFYGLENTAARLLPRKEGRLRRVAFAQCALLGEANIMERAAQPEDEHGRFTRGLALWLAETFHAGAGYEAFAGIGTFAPEHFALFPAEWSAENVRQLHETTEGGLAATTTTSSRSASGR